MFVMVLSRQKRRLKTEVKVRNKNPTILILLDEKESLRLTNQIRLLFMVADKFERIVFKMTMGALR